MRASFHWFGVVAAAIVFAACGGTAPHHEAQADASPPQSPAFLSDVTSRVITSQVSKRSYQVSVALPEGYSAAHAPYPVLYAADANSEFGTVVETARTFSFSQQIPDLVIVGIGYARPGQGLKASFAPRTLDLTPSEDKVWAAATAKEAAEEGVAPPEGTGGAAAFFAFIRDELVPSIEKSYNVSRDRAWYGHSFGGLFGVYLLFNGGDMFQRFIIGSPSLWWDKRAMFAAEEAFAASRKPLAGRVFLSVGALEQQFAPAYPMVRDLQAFTERLKRRKYSGLHLQTYVFEGENHLSVIPAIISRGLRVIYPQSDRDEPAKQ